MKHALSIFFVLVICLVAVLAHASWIGLGAIKIKDVKGVLVETSGRVNIVGPKGRPLDAKIGSEMDPGSKISVGDGGGASVMLMDGEIVKVAGGQTYIVGASSKTAEKKTVMRGITLALNEAAEVSLPVEPSPSQGFGAEGKAPSSAAGPRVQGMVKMGNPSPTAGGPMVIPLGRTAKGKPPSAAKAATNQIEAVFPSDTAIRLPDEIEFKWSGKIGFAKPVLVFEGTNGERKPVDIPSKTSNVKASASVLGLKKGGKYSWYLASSDDKAGRGRTRRISFTILTDDMERKLDQDMKRIDETADSKEGRSFLKGQLYFNYGMYNDMVTALLPVWEKEKSPTVKKLLKLGYARMGMIEEARKYR